MMVNIPIEQIVSADLRVHRDGTGDILLRASADRQLYWVLLWPNVSAWYSRPVRPCLRGLSDPHRAATAFAGVASQQVDVVTHDQNADKPQLMTRGHAVLAS